MVIIFVVEVVKRVGIVQPAGGRRRFRDEGESESPRPQPVKVQLGHVRCPTFSSVTRRIIMDNYNPPLLSLLLPRVHTASQSITEFPAGHDNKQQKDRCDTDANIAPSLPAIYDRGTFTSLWYLVTGL